MAQSYGKRPSEIVGIVNDLVAYDFDAAILYKAMNISKGIITDKKVIKQNQTTGFMAMKALQNKVQSSYNRGK